MGSRSKRQSAVGVWVKMVTEQSLEDRISVTRRLPLTAVVPRGESWESPYEDGPTVPSPLDHVLAPAGRSANPVASALGTAESRRLCSLVAALARGTYPRFDRVAPNRFRSMTASAIAGLDRLMSPITPRERFACGACRTGLPGGGIAQPLAQVGARPSSSSCGPRPAFSWPRSCSPAKDCGPGWSGRSPSRTSAPGSPLAIRCTSPWPPASRWQAPRS